MSLASTVSTIRIQTVHLKYWMSLVSTVPTIRIQTEGFSDSTTSVPDEPCINSVDNLNAEFSHLIEPQTPVSTVSTNIALYALHASIFISTVSTNKIPYSFELQCRSLYEDFELQ